MTLNGSTSPLTTPVRPQSVPEGPSPRVPVPGSSTTQTSPPETPGEETRPSPVPSGNPFYGQHLDTYA